MTLYSIGDNLPNSAVRSYANAAVLLALSALFHTSISAQEPVQGFASAYRDIDKTGVWLTHARVIDGTGAPPVEDQAIEIQHGTIAWVGATSRAPRPSKGMRVIDLTGRSVIPGLVGMHDHLFYTAYLEVDEAGGQPAPGFLLAETAYSAPRLYLAGGVTTIRTTGSIEPYTDLEVKRQIEAGILPGPRMDVTSPFIQGPGGPYPQMHVVENEQEARRFVQYWASVGVTSFKVYTHATRAVIAAAINESHRLGFRITGHLCSVGYREAVALGIDDLEHGPIYSDSEFVPGKLPDVCPSRMDIANAWAHMTMSDRRVRSLIEDLVAHHVAVTSTLPVWEMRVPGRPPLRRKVLDAMSVSSRESYLLARNRALTNPIAPLAAAELRKEMEFERDFARAGGLLLAGPDPTGAGGVLPGYGDQREVELLVEGGFSPVDAIKVATLNGASYLGQAEVAGSVRVGKRADLVVVKGNPADRIEDIENVENVFKDGVAYDPAKLVRSVTASFGIR